MKKTNYMGQTISYLVSVNGYNDKHDINISGTLTESGAFDYGNHTAVKLDITNNGKTTTEWLDTRYAKGIISDFPTWLEGLIRDNWNVIEIERV